MPCLTTLRLMARLALMAAYSRGSGRAATTSAPTTQGWRLAHLVDTELPLHEGDDPPVVEVGEDQSRAQPSVRRALQREQGRLQPDPGAKRGNRP
jgi:hypothetical protein